ncbi:MAG: hypothetical protein BWK76_14180 [Desulfobulbaceae bacterium A2]|nr:MAG: hypothetical protein BWK76_14180 [Desulfobulbaceae bacterium A2]
MKTSAHVNRLLSRQEAFSLLEVLVAIIVFAIGMLSLAALQVAAIKGNANARKMTEAGVAAQEGLERVMQEPYATTLGRLNTSQCFNSSATVAHAPYANPAPTARNPDNIDDDFDESLCDNMEYLLTVVGPPAGSTFLITDGLWITVVGFFDEGSGRQRTVPLTYVKSQNMESSYVPAP